MICGFFNVERETARLVEIVIEEIKLLTMHINHRKSNRINGIFMVVRRHSSEAIAYPDHNGKEKEALASDTHSVRGRVPDIL